IELEKLNSATDDINKFEVELDEAKSDFKLLLVESVEKIKNSAHKLTNSIQTAKPYYEARLYAAQLQKECQLALINHEKAKSIHVAAKEMVHLAEQGLGEQSTLDTACQEMLSHAASRVNQSQIEFIEARNVLKICELKQDVANNRVTKLQSQLKSAIKASRPYYETRANYNGILKEQKKRIVELELKVSNAKSSYNDALKNLEQISEEIHKMREERRLSNDMVENYDNDECIENSTSNFTDEYLDFPSKLSTKASPIRQKNLEKLDCPHLMRDFVSYPQQGSSTELSSPSKVDGTFVSNDDFDQWTEIRLSNSESTITCTTIFTSDDNTTVRKDDEHFTNWITKSHVKNSSRRQSLDILIDASDKVKDVFALSFQKVGKTLERRSSESEVSSDSSDFFSFSRSENKDGLSDEQVENLLLNEDCTDIPYYETRANYNGILKEQKKRIVELELKVSNAKSSYNDALKNLEQISEEIHKMREERRLSNDMVENYDNDECIENSTSNFTDEYLDFPSKLSTKASPIRQKNLEKLDCPHLMRDFVSYPQQGSSTELSSPSKVDGTFVSNDDFDQWTEIRLSNSESTITCTTIFTSDDNTTVRKDDEHFTNWITKSHVKNSSRRQSLDILIDASDKVKDVFALSFQKVGKTLERRSSESEVSSDSSDFFSFSRSENKDGLSDEQVENLLLNEDCTDMLTISK
ncbi:SH3 domain-binding protein 5-like, partial [Pseudolycoriella hygida]